LLPQHLHRLQLVPFPLLQNMTHLPADLQLLSGLTGPSVSTLLVLLPEQLHVGIEHSFGAGDFLCSFGPLLVDELTLLVGPVDLSLFFQLLCESVAEWRSGYILLTKASLRSLRARRYFSCWFVTSSCRAFCFSSIPFRNY
jgi:hypothetical protein